MAYYANEAYNKQTSNEGFWESAGTGIGVGAATAAGVVGAAQGVSMGIMKHQNISASRQLDKLGSQRDMAMAGLNAQHAARNVNFYAGPKGNIPISPQVKEAAAKEHRMSSQAVSDSYAAQSAAIDKKYENTKANRFHNKAFGGGWRKTAAVYGGAAVMGGITGGSIDYLND